MQKIIIPNKILLPQVVELLNAGKKVTINVKGFSMHPFIRGDRDSVILKKLDVYNVGDIVLANIGDNVFVIHRIINISNNIVTLMGDGNVVGVEKCKLSDVAGVVDTIIRKGKNVDPNSKKELRRSKLWKKLLPIRRYLLAFYRRIIIKIFPIFFLFFLTNCTNTPNNQVENAITSIKNNFLPDSRIAIFEITHTTQGKTSTLKGKTTSTKAKEALIANLTKNGYKILDSIQLLPNNTVKKYGIAIQSVTNNKTQGKYSAEMATQALMGTPLKILENVNGWLRVITPDNYISWVTQGSVKQLDSTELGEYKKLKKVIVTSNYSTIYKKTDKKEVISDIVKGNILIDLNQIGIWRKVAIADGREGYVLKEDVIIFDEFLKRVSTTNGSDIIKTAKQFIGIPYMWGGTSVKAMDCSGFVKNVYFLNGYITARDASQQCFTGDSVDIAKYVAGDYSLKALENLSMGDLIFFGQKGTQQKKERITHVGIYIGEGKFIHSATMVKINSLLPESNNYYEYSNTLLRARRILGNLDNGKGVKSVGEFYN